MEGFGHEDGASGGEDGFVGDEARRAEIGRSADAFENGGESEEGLDIGEFEIVGASSDRGIASSGDGGLEE